jgi:hypothetical protein
MLLAKNGIDELLYVANKAKRFANRLGTVSLRRLRFAPVLEKLSWKGIP